MTQRDEDVIRLSVAGALAVRSFLALLAFRPP
jgi:hypothetical protein